MKLTLLESQESKISDETKIHATVSDPNNSLKIGKRIDYRLENNQRFFNPIVVSSQQIEIAVRKNTNSYELIYLQIDKKDCSDSLRELSINEGYDNEQQYLTFIYKTAKERPRVNLNVLRGKILHWTKKKY